MSLAAKEAKLRRLANGMGLTLTKSRSRSPELPGYCGYMIVDQRANFVVAGADPFAFSVDLDEVCNWLAN